MEASLKTIIFKLNDQYFGIEVNNVTSIERLQKITEVPGTEKHIKGLISLRGEIMPIIDLKERLSFNQESQTEDGRILIIKTDDIQAGLIIDEATEVLNIRASEIETAPGIIDGLNNNFIHGITKINERLIILLNLENILNSVEDLEPEKMGENSIRETEGNGKDTNSR